MRWRAQTTMYRDSVDLLAVEDHGERRYIGGRIDMVMKLHEPHSIIEEPTLSLPPESARSLLQALWDAGLRPADWSSPDGEINAMRKHVDFAEHVAKTLLSQTESGTNHA